MIVRLASTITVKLRSKPYTVIQIGRYGQPYPVTCDLLMLEHYYKRKKIENLLSHVYAGVNFYIAVSYFWPWMSAPHVL